jgi:hypothetical protein
VDGKRWAGSRVLAHRLAHHIMRLATSASGTKLARAPRADVLDRTLPVQALDDRSDLFANRRAEHAVGCVKAFSCDYPADDVIGAQQLARCRSEHAET